MNIEKTVYKQEMTEKNHLSKNPILLISSILPNFTIENKENKGKKKVYTIKNTTLDDKTVIVIDKYWIRESEYLLWKNKLKNKSINRKIINCKITYMAGLAKNEDYYIGELKIDYLKNI